MNDGEDKIDLPEEKQKLIAFHPDEWKELGWYLDMNTVDQDTIRIRYVPHKEKQVAARPIKGGARITFDVTYPSIPQSIIVPAKLHKVMGNSHLVWIDPQTNKNWLTPQDFARLRDLSSYSEILNRLRVNEDAVYMFKEAVNQKDATIDSLEGRVSKIEGHAALMTAETKMFESAISSIRNQMADAETRLTHYKAKMETATILHKDASEMLQQFPELFKLAQTMVLRTKEITDQMQDTLIHKRTRSIEEIKERVASYENKIKEIENKYQTQASQIFDNADRRIEQIKEQAQNEPSRAAASPVGTEGGGAGAGTKSGGVREAQGATQESKGTEPA